ncbi:hypothetical protein ACJX0J_026251, partial [Zea mays]
MPVFTALIDKPKLGNCSLIPSPFPLTDTNSNSTLEEILPEKNHPHGMQHENRMHQNGFLGRVLQPKQLSGTEISIAREWLRNYGLHFGRSHTQQYKYGRLYTRPIAIIGGFNWRLFLSLYINPHRMHAKYSHDITCGRGTVILAITKKMTYNTTCFMLSLLHWERTKHAQ